MIDFPYLPRPERRLRRGFGCLGFIVTFPLLFGCLSVFARQIQPFAPVVFVLFLAVLGLYIWLARSNG